MTEQHSDSLTAAQHHRTMVLADFFDLVIASQARLRDHPEELDSIKLVIQAEVRRLAASFDATALAIINRVAGIVGIEQATRAEQVAGLRKEIETLARESAELRDLVRTLLARLGDAS